MTRSHKANGKNHAGIAEGTALPVENGPKFFGKHGFEGVDPKKTKKNGCGKGNWGGPCEEVADEEFNWNHLRRRSNSFGATHHLAHFKTKFEVNEPEPVFEEGLHGAPPAIDDDEPHAALAKTETTSSSGGSDYDHKENKDM